MMQSILTHLAPLVACDTQNPPRDIDKGHPIFTYLCRQLEPGFDVRIWDHGNGCVSLLAVRGKPDVLFNVHLDTVPVGNGWRMEPLTLTVTDDRAYGRGACDIKGAAACLLALAEATDRPLAMLFTTDEEGASGCCVDKFLASGFGSGYRQIVVAEPTNSRAAFAHRGFVSVHGRFRGCAGHSSEPYALTDNAIHRFSRWSAAALDYAAEQARAGCSTCFNLGRIEGGIKSNVIADQLDINWSARLAAGESNRRFLTHVFGLADPNEADWQVRFAEPPLPAAGGDNQAALRYAEAFGLPTCDALNFWTEAALFGKYGFPALVLGPGDIAQAHTADEWVSLAQLQQTYQHYSTIVHGHD